MKNEIYIRPAKDTDSKDIWSWRNDPVTRENSPNDDEVSWDEHSAWFTAALNDPNKIIFMGVDAEVSVSVGMVRFDINEDGFTAEVSINLNPSWRGKKISSHFLSLAIAEIQKTSPFVLTAEIKSENTPSIHCFKRCAFSLYAEEAGVLTFKNKQGIIDAIENVRANNNVNWMDLLRLAFRVAPQEAEEIVGRINSDDGRISNLINMLSK